MKRCGKCEELKEETEFYRCFAHRDGLHSWCKSCVALWGRERYRKRETPSGSAKKSYWYRRERGWKKSGILTVNGAPFLRNDFEKCWEAQNGACAMCGKSFGPLPDGVRKVNVDHWHKWGKYGPVRALLCWLCNRRVGDLTYETAKPLWEYLSRFKPEDPPSSDSPPRAPQHVSAPARTGV